MIIGIGQDSIEIARIENSLHRFGQRFVRRLFTKTEQTRSDRRVKRAASYAKRFAAKEACAKALGTGMAGGVAWRDIGVVNEPSGKPTLQLTGRARRRLKSLTPAGHETRLHLTLSDTDTRAEAFVIIEAVPV